MLSSRLPLQPGVGGHQGDRATVADLNVHESDGELTGVDSDIEEVGLNEVTVFFWSSVSKIQFREDDIVTIARQTDFQHFLPYALPMSNF